MLLLTHQSAFARPKHGRHLATPGRGSAISQTSELMSVTFPKDLLCSASFIKSRTRTGAVECPGSCSLGTLFVADKRQQGASDRLRSGTGANKFMAKTVHLLFMMINHPPRRGARISRDLMGRRNILSHTDRRIIIFTASSSGRFPGNILNGLYVRHRSVYPGKSKNVLPCRVRYYNSSD